MKDLYKHKLYTLEEIRAAFWKQFHASGELWFPYPDEENTDENCAEYTELAWKDFVYDLTGRWPGEDDA